MLCSSVILSAVNAFGSGSVDRGAVGLVGDDVGAAVGGFVVLSFVGTGSPTGAGVGLQAEIANIIAITITIVVYRFITLTPLKEIKL